MATYCAEVYRSLYESIGISILIEVNIKQLGNSNGQSILYIYHFRYTVLYSRVVPFLNPLSFGTWQWI